MFFIWMFYVFWFHLYMSMQLSHSLIFNSLLYLLIMLPLHPPSLNIKPKLYYLRGKSRATKSTDSFKNVGYWVIALFHNPSIRVTWFTGLPTVIQQLTVSYHVIATFWVCRHFMGMNLAVLNSTLRRHLQRLLKAKIPQNQKDWKEEGLFSFSYSLLFK